MLPAHADWGRRAPIWDTDGGGSNRIALFPPLPRAATPPHPASPHLTPPQPPWFFWSSRGHPPAERILWQGGGGFGTPPGGLAFGRTLAKLPGEED